MTRTFCNEFHWEKHLWDFFSPFFDVMGAYLIIDDTILEKPYSKVSRVIGFFIRWCFSHKDNRYVKWIQVIFLLLVVGKLDSLLGFRIYDKSKTKIE